MKTVLTANTRHSSYYIYPVQIFLINVFLVSGGEEKLRWVGSLKGQLPEQLICFIVNRRNQNEGEKVLMRLDRSLGT